jgi:hypothetical protein
MALPAAVSGVILFALSLKKLSGHFVTSTTRKLAEPESTVAADVDASVLIITAAETAGRTPNGPRGLEFSPCFCYNHGRRSHARVLRSLAGWKLFNRGRR